MLKVGGVFVAPSEIENCLLQHQAVLECAVVGHADGDGLVKERRAFRVLRLAGDVSLGHDGEPVREREPQRVADDLQGRDAVLGGNLFTGGNDP